MSTINCPACGLFNNATAKYCNRCGSAISVNFESERFSDYKQFILARNALSEKYTLLSELGHGGMANVYKAIQKNLDRIVAIKIIHSTLLTNSESVNLFHKEAKIAASLKHPNIITIYDEGEINGIQFIVMEYLDGMDLSKILRNEGVISENKFKSIFIPIAEALQYLHDKELIHGDIKSSNVFVTDDGRPILMDFGIAKMKSIKQKMYGSPKYGTPEYMSPEQAKNEVIDERTDLFSLGIAMYESLTGKLPFQGDSLQDILDSIKLGEYIPPRSINKYVSKKVERIIAKLLSNNPEFRYQTGSELIQEFQKKIVPLKLNRKTILISAIVSIVFIMISSIFILLQTNKIPDQSPDQQINSSIFESVPGNSKIEDYTHLETIIPGNSKINNQHQIPQSNSILDEKKLSKSMNLNGQTSFDSLIEIGSRLRDQGIKLNSKVLLEQAEEKFSKALKIDPQAYYAVQQIEYIKTIKNK
ncbi:MAG: protein kinase [Bacteroidales bacterium]|nr:protein kinase [Bacteroidales bacterium]